MKKFLFAFSFALFVGVLFFSGCGENKSAMVKLRIGVISGPEEQVAEVAAKIAREHHNINVELVAFSDYLMPNAALDDGTLDANAFQHLPFLNQQALARGYKLAVAGKTFLYPLAGYSKRFKKVADLPDRARVAVPNDQSNQGRALLLLAGQGLITLRAGVGANASVLDIIDNPKKLRILELDAAQLPRALPDVDLAVINTTFASQIGLTPAVDGLFIEDKNSPYVNLIVTREGRENDPAVRAFVQAYQTEEVLRAAEKLFPGSVVKGW
ncbi:MAG: MetQ/NlpA family lipoprotein [Puniceicoccales bacterium]|nr:MetQ/NlpA family lipoprotein [Puniceicoccales bacterium]